MRETGTESDHQRRLRAVLRARRSPARTSPAAIPRLLLPLQHRGADIGALTFSDLPKEIKDFISEKVIYAYGIDYFLTNRYKTLGVVHRSLNTPITLELSKAILKTCGFDIENAKFAPEVRSRIGTLFGENITNIRRGVHRSFVHIAAKQMFEAFAPELGTPMPEPLPGNYHTLAGWVMKMVFRSAKLLEKSDTEWITKRAFHDIWHHHSAYAIEQVLEYAINVSQCLKGGEDISDSTPLKIITQTALESYDDHDDYKSSIYSHPSIAAALILWNSRMRALKRKHGFSRDLDGGSTDPNEPNSPDFQTISQTLFKHVFAMCVEHLMKGLPTGEGLPKFGQYEMEASFTNLEEWNLLEPTYNPFNSVEPFYPDDFVKQLGVILPELEFVEQNYNRTDAEFVLDDYEKDYYSKAFQDKLDSMLQENDGYKKYSNRLYEFMTAILIDFGTVFIGQWNTSPEDPMFYINSLVFMSEILKRQEEKLGIDTVMELERNKVENSIAIKVFDFLVEQELGRDETGFLSEEFRTWTLNAESSTSGREKYQTYEDWCSIIAVHWMKPAHRRRFQETFPGLEASPPPHPENVRRFDSEDVGITLEGAEERTMKDLKEMFLYKQASQSEYVNGSSSA
jgi:hypothetical protein